MLAILPCQRVKCKEGLQDYVSHFAAHVHSPCHNQAHTALYVRRRVVNKTEIPTTLPAGTKDKSVNLLMGIIEVIEVVQFDQKVHIYQIFIQLLLLTGIWYV